jgi:agmatinase
VGLPDDSQSSFHRGCAEAPPRIRSAYDGNCYSATSESGVDLTGSVADLGDWAPQASWELTSVAYRESAARLFRAGKVPFFAGGDHGVTVPIVLGQPVYVIQFDAHPDLYPEYEGGRTSHACVAARLLEMEHVAGVTQLGIRTLNAPQAAEAERHRERLLIYQACDLPEKIPALDHIPANALVYITLDLDGLDPAFAPGVAHPVPGGLAPRQVLDFLQRFPWRLAGMDAVEVHPGRDVNDQTAILAARLIHEGMGRAARQP